MSTPKFSVIVPTHNAAGYIRKGLDSVRIQTFRDYELIVVCDDCTDNTEQIAREYTDKVFTVQYGLDGMSRNKGIDEARGEWVLFMDDDDWWLHEFVLEQLARAARPDADLICFDFIWKGVGYAAQTDGHLFVAVWNKMWRRSFIGDTRFPDVPYWSDTQFHRDMLLKRPRTYALNRPMYYYNYLRPGSISWRKEQGEIE